MVIYSHSKLSTFEQCPLKYKFRYIDKIPPEIKQTIEGFLGNRVHEALEWLYNELGKGNCPELDEVLKTYAASWHKNFNDNIKIIKQGYDSNYYFEKGINFLISYFNRNFPFKDNTIAVEKKLTFSLDEEGRYLIEGYVDRLVHNKEDNIFEIHDYKTSGSAKSNESFENDRQLALYSIGIKKIYPNAEDIHLIWHYLDFDKQITSKRTEEQLEELKQKIIQLINKIESTQEFQFNEGILCNWCEFKNHCSKVRGV